MKQDKTKVQAVAPTSGTDLLEARIALLRGQHGFVEARAAVAQLREVVREGARAGSGAELAASADKAIEAARALLKDLMKLRRTLPGAR